MKDKLITKAFHGSLWLVATNFGNILVRFCSIAVLARLLEPKLFGIFALLKLIYVVPTTILSSHISKNIILLREKKGILINGIYSILFSSVIISLIIIVFADKLVIFLNESDLKPLIRNTFYLPLILNLNTVIDSIFSKKLDFKKIAIRNFLSLLISVVLTIILSINGFGIWSLIYGFIVGELMKLFLLIINLKFDSYKFNLNIIKLLHKNYFSINGTQLLFQTVQNIDKTIISKYLSASILGFYVKGVQIAKMPINLLANPLQKVGFSTLALKSDDNQFLIKSMSNAINILFKILFPVALLVFIFSDLIIKILLGDGWIQSVPILKIMSFYMFFSFLLKVFTTILASKEDFGRIFLIHIINTLIIIFGSINLVKNGVEGISYTILLACILSCFVGLVMCINVLQTSIITISKPLLKVVFLSLLLLLFVFISDNFLSKTNLYLKVFFQFTIVISFLIRNIYTQKIKLKL